MSMSHLVGRENFHGIKELFNLPPLVLKTGHDVRVTESK